MTPLRRTIAERLVHAQHTAAILTTFNEVDLSAVMALRARHQEAFVAKHGVKLGFMSFFVKAAGIEPLERGAAAGPLRAAQGGSPGPLRAAQGGSPGPLRAAQGGSRRPGERRP